MSCILTCLKLKTSFLFGLPLSSRITKAILASSGNTPYFRLLFITIIALSTLLQQTVLSISTESLTNLGSNSSKPAALLT